MWRWQVGGTSFVALVAIALAAAAIQAPEPPKTFHVSIEAASQPGAGDGDSPPAIPAPVHALQVQVANALSASEWPANLAPTMDESIGGKQAPDEFGACGQPGPVDLEGCGWGPDSATKTAVIVGDSVGMTWAGPAKSVVTARQGWKFYDFAQFGCVFTSTVMQNGDPDAVSACPDRKSTAIAAIKNLKPDVVLVGNTYSQRTPIGADEPLSGVELATDMEKLIDTFSGSVGKFVFLAAPPESPDPASCYSPRSVPADCVGEVPAAWFDRYDAESDLADKLGGEIVDTSSLFCVDQLCPPFVDTTPVRVDPVHMTPEYGAKLTPALAAELRSALTPSSPSSPS